jgi:hypothetical protein
VIADLSAATGGGGGGGGAALLSFTGGTSSSARPIIYGFAFTLSESKTIKGAGFYDQGQNGLEAHNWIVLSTLSDPYTPIGFDAAGNVQEITIPIGTTAPLSGPWRRVDLGVAGRVLQAGVEYALLTYGGLDPNDPSGPEPTGVDSFMRNVTGVSVLSGASYMQNISDIDGFGVAVTNSSAGTAYFGPMLFFE